MRLVSWNVNGFNKSEPEVAAKLAALRERDADVIALQEIRNTTWPWWEAGLAEMGYEIVSGRGLAARPYPPPPYPPEARATDQIYRTYFNLIASRVPITEEEGLSFPDPEEAALAVPEKYVTARIELDGSDVRVHNFHAPPGVSLGVIKVHAFEAVRRRLDLDAGKPRILCGDFNAPDYEDDEGPFPSGRRDRRVIHRRNPLFKRWDAAEEGLMTIPELRDVYRDKHKRGEEFPVSFYTGGVRSGKGPRRYDYVFASDGIETKRCRYLTPWLEDGLSDHAGVEAELTIRKP